MIILTLLAMMMTLRNNSETSPSSPNPPAVVYRDVAVAGGAPLNPSCTHTLFYYFTQFHHILLYFQGVPHCPCYIHTIFYYHTILPYFHREPHCPNIHTLL